jgi:hypothetical protein
MRVSFESHRNITGRAGALLSLGEFDERFAFF